MASHGGGRGGDVPRKRRRLCHGNNNLLLSSDAVICCSSSSSTSTDKTFWFNDSVTADVELHLHLHLYDDDESKFGIYDLNDVYLYLHSDVLRRRSQYFSALLSDRWQREEEEEEEKKSDSSWRSRRVFNLTYKVPASMKSIDTHRIVIELLYSTDVNFSQTINTVSSALSILPVAVELLFEDCVKACIRLVEALPWTEEEEQRVVLDLIPLLTEEESQELLSRVSPEKTNSSDEMLLRLIQELRLNHHRKDFVGKMLRDFSSRDSDSVRLALDQAFEMALKLLKEALQSACSSVRPREAIWWEEILCCSSERRQTEEEKTLAGCGGYLFWLIERMIELRIADTTTLDRWIDQQGSLTENLQKVCSDKTISPRCLVNVILCTWMLADAVATGSIVADRQVRMKLLKVWLPVVLCVKGMVLQLQLEHNISSHRFEEPFFKIISTLPMSESQELLLQCLGFSNHNKVNDCPHLESAYKTWFRRAATQQPPKGN